MKRMAKLKVLSQAPLHQEPDNTLITTPPSVESQQPLSLEPFPTDTLEPPLTFQPLEPTHMDNKPQSMMLSLVTTHTSNTQTLFLMELNRLLTLAQLHMDQPLPPSTARNQPFQEDTAQTLM